MALQRCLKGAVGTVSLQERLQGPVLLLNKFFNLFLPFTDQAKSHRLNPSGTETAANIAPEQGADLVPYEAIQDPAGLLSINPVHIDRTGMFECFLDRVFSDLIKLDPAGQIGIDF